MPEKSIIHWIVIKEPNKIIESKGGIYVLAESVYKPDKSFIKIFNYKVEDMKPRLFEFPYSRKLHEQLQKEVMNKLRKGQPVHGRFTEKEKGAKGPRGKSGKKDRDGDGSESQSQDWEFHELPPSEIHRKPRERIPEPFPTPIDPRQTT